MHEFVGQGHSTACGAGHRKAGAAESRKSYPIWASPIADYLMHHFDCCGILASLEKQVTTHFFCRGIVEGRQGAGKKERRKAKLFIHKNYPNRKQKTRARLLLRCCGFRTPNLHGMECFSGRCESDRASLPIKLRTNRKQNTPVRLITPPFHKYAEYNNQRRIRICGFCG